MAIGIGLTAAGVAQAAVGAAVYLSAKEPVCGVVAPCTPGDAPSKHRLGGALMALGGATTAVGLPLALWGAKRNGPSADVKVGLGTASATFTF